MFIIKSNDDIKFLPLSKFVNPNKAPNLNGICLVNFCFIILSTVYGNVVSTLGALPSISLSCISFHVINSWILLNRSLTALQSLSQQCCAQFGRNLRDGLRNSNYKRYSYMR